MLLNRMADIGLVIQAATEADLDEVLRIERASFNSPWPVEHFKNELQNTCSRFLAARAGGGALAGFAVCWMVVDELHLINLAVAPEWRRQGIARSLMDCLLVEGRTRGGKILSLEVRKGNQAAISLYRSLGCVAVGIRPGYYADNNEDALVMICDLEEGCSEGG